MSRAKTRVYQKDSNTSCLCCHEPGHGRSFDSFYCARKLVVEKQMMCTNQWFKLFSSAVLVGPIVMRASQFIIFGLTTMVFSTFCDQSAQAGPLAEAVERAKAAAGVQIESAAEEQEAPRDTAQPAMPLSAQLFCDSLIDCRLYQVNVATSFFNLMQPATHNRVVATLDVLWN